MSVGKLSRDSAYSQTLRILHVVPTYLPATRYGGPIYSVHGLCKALARNGHDVHVFTTNVDGGHDSDVPLMQAVELEGVKVWYFPSRFLRRLFYAPAMARALKSRLGDFDVVHLHSVFLWPTWAAARLARKAGVPYIVAPRGMMVRGLVQRKSRWLKTAWIKLIEQRTLENAAGIHVTSPIERREIESFQMNLRGFFNIPNGIDEMDLTSLERNASDLVPEVPYVLFLGRISWKKGLDRLVRAWRLVPGRLLLIAGNDEEGYRREVEQLAKAEGVAERIRFVGPVRGNEKWLLYKHADLFVLPSYSENFGVVVLEAMAMGCPVVVTPEVGLAEVVAETDCGRVVDGEPVELAGAINEILADGDLRSAMGRRGQAIATARFRWGDVAVQMEVAYRQPVGRAAAMH